MVQEAFARRGYAVPLFGANLQCHRTHYDRDYVTRSEGYPGLVVHGPLIATLLVDLVRRSQPNAQVIALSFRAGSPLFDGSPILLNGTPPGKDGVAKLWAANVDGRLAMTAEATLAERARRADRSIGSRLFRWSKR